MQQSIPDNVWICKTKDEVMRIVRDNRLVVVKLGARWCGPCKTAIPGYQRMAGEYADFSNIAFLSVDIDDNPMYNEEITAVPAFLFYVDGELRGDMMQLGADINAVHSVVTQLVEGVNQTGEPPSRAPPMQAFQGPPGYQQPVSPQEIGGYGAPVQPPRYQLEMVGNGPPNQVGGYPESDQMKGGYATHDEMPDTRGPRMGRHP